MLELATGLMGQLKRCQESFLSVILQAFAIPSQIWCMVSFSVGLYVAQDYLCGQESFCEDHSHKNHQNTVSGVFVSCRLKVDKCTSDIHFNIC